MQTKERVIHAVLFEAFALLLTVPLAALVTSHNVTDITVIAVGLCFYTVCWNYIYNLWFDKVIKIQRNQRSWLVRIIHCIGFESGIIVVTIPVVAWFLSITLLQALALEAGFLIFFFTYALAFNWVYDKCKYLFFDSLSAN